MTIMRGACLFLLILSINPVVNAQCLDRGKLDSFFDAAAASNKAMGSMAIAKNGQLIYKKAFGFSFYTREQKIPSSENSKYRVGSISKIFTATIVFQLIEENKLSLSTTLSHFFADFPHAPEITIGHLLNHRSGIRDIKKIEDKQRPRSREEMLAFVAKMPLQHKPGTRTAYSNCNFLLLGYVIEKICGRPYEQVLFERIIAPLGLQNTGMGRPSTADNNECFPFEYTTDWEQQPQTDASIPGASGGLVSTPADLLVFINALFTMKLISDQSLQQMRTFTKGFGMGFLEFEFEKRKAIGYTGGIDEYESVLAFFPGDSLAIAYCSNGHVYPTRSLVIGALHIYFNKPYAIPDFNSVAIKTPDLKIYTGVYSSSDLPIKIKITRHQQYLVAHAEGYPPYALFPAGPNRFRSDEASVAIEFNTKNNSLKLKRDARSYVFTKLN
jgi:CubicO group peptidase (beta-lactamase class C family)